MQTLTFTQKLLRQRSFLSSLLPLFALFLGLGFAQNAQAQMPGTSTSGLRDVTVTTNGSRATYDAVPTAGGTGPAPSGTTGIFANTDFGPIDLNSGQFVLNGGTLTINQLNGENFTNASLGFRTFAGNLTSVPTGTQAAFTYIDLGVPVVNGNVATFTLPNADQNLIRNLMLGGPLPGTTYRFDITYSASGNDAAGNPIFLVGATTRRSVFEAVGTPNITDAWEGTVNDDWFNPANWSLRRVPDATTNVSVPVFPTGSGQVYFNINAGVNYTPQASTYKPAGSTVTTGSSLGGQNANSGPALSKSITFEGTSQANRSIGRLVNGTLKVYGDFFNQYDSYIQRIGSGSSTTSVTEFASIQDVTITGGTFTRTRISGGGQKVLTGIMTIEVAMNFTPNGGIVSTDTRFPNTNALVLASRSSNAPNGAMLFGEENSSFLRGFARTFRDNVGTNELTNPALPFDPVTNPIRFRTYGNLGFDINFKTGNPGNVTVTRNTAESYTPLNTANGRPSAYGIRRIFGVRPDGLNNNNNPLTADTRFRYLTSELMNLGPNRDGSIMESNLGLFVSTNGGSTFGLLGRDGPVDLANHVVTKNNVSTFATFTLGDLTRPLPVSLTRFDAKRVGSDALVTWQTVTELNSRGYDVQVSTDGKEYHSLGFVTSVTPNSVKLINYSYLDIEKGKSGQRYYRLRQVDMDGKETFFIPKIVDFAGNVTATTLAAYPNPLNSYDQLHLSLQTKAEGSGQVTITDMTGRVVSQQKVMVVVGNNDVVVNGLNELKAGLYLVRFTSPTGQVQNLKIQKQ